MHNKKIIYQIYPMSFKDSNNDGIGDLNGISEKINYLKWLEVDYIWISPFYKTPFKDNGYDISNYYDIDKKFGTKDDLIKLINKANESGLKIMIDLVFNHTSTKHLWFKKWLKGDKEYKDFYISKYSRNKPPNNWKSKFGGSAWKEYKKNYWYLCLFDKTQADLNWENINVRKKIYEVIKHYIKLGVKGFRFDVINLISKTSYDDDYEEDGRKFYTDGYKMHDFLKELRRNFPIDKKFLTIGELSSTNIKETIKYTNKNKEELDCAFTFHHLKIDYDEKGKFIYKEPNFKKLNDVLAKWYENVYMKGSLVGFLNNHDQPRSVSRFIKNKSRYNEGSKMLFALMASLPGNSCIYQGEEIRMENCDFKNIDNFKDVETINFLNTTNSNQIPKGVKQKSRDNSRTPFQWNALENAGFSKVEPWIKVNDNYKYINVETQIKNKNSTLWFYKDYINFIKNDNVLKNGDLLFHNFKENIISYSRKFNNIEYKFVFNLSDYEMDYVFDGDIIKTNYINISKNKIQPYGFLIIRK